MTAPQHSLTAPEPPSPPGIPSPRVESVSLGEFQSGPRKRADLVLRVGRPVVSGWDPARGGPGGTCGSGQPIATFRVHDSPESTCGAPEPTSDGTSRARLPRSVSAREVPASGLAPSTCESRETATSHTSIARLFGPILHDKVQESTPCPQRTNPPKSLLYKVLSRFAGSGKSCLPLLGS